MLIIVHKRGYILNKNISIFISYSWKDKVFVDELDQRMRKCGYFVERDIRDAEYAQSIKKFMKRIRKTDYSIIVLSDDFLKSENCMYEILEFIKDDNYKYRIIPVIINSAKDIWGSNKGISYTIFWKERAEEFKGQLKLIDEESKSGYIEDLKHITLIKDSIGEIIKIFRDMKMFDASDEKLVENIIECIKKKRNNKGKSGIWLLIFFVVVMSIVIYMFITRKKQTDNFPQQLDSANYLGNTIMSESSYKSVIIEKANQEIIYSHYNDFDSDGICELFAIVGLEVDDNVIKGEIWFANQEEVIKIEETRYYWKYPRTYLFGNDIFIAFEEYYSTGSVTYLWGVKNGKPFQPNLTAKAYGFGINNYNEIVITNSAYDGVKTIYDDWKVLPDDEVWTLHTYNQYYYFWNGENFREYGAIEITKDELMEIDGTDKVIDYINGLGATINEIFFRANNIIQINYQKEEREVNATSTYYYNIMFRYEGETVRLEDCELGEGNVFKALNPSLAVYPDKFDIGIHNNRQ